MQKNKKFQLILGSSSPRRQELLKYTYLPFEVRTSNIEEHSNYLKVDEIVCDLAKQKAEAVFKKIGDEFSNPLVIGADTIVCLDGKILGKPADHKEAAQMLLLLSGRTHDVLTGICLFSQNKVSTFYAKTKVTFEEITSDLLEHYLATGESLDKAGAYGIQAYSLGFIGDIEGSYSNVVGLPVNLVLHKLKEFVSAQTDQTGQWRSYFE